MSLNRSVNNPKEFCIFVRWVYFFDDSFKRFYNFICVFYKGNIAHWTDSVRTPATQRGCILWFSLSNVKDKKLDFVIKYPKLF